MEEHSLPLLHISSKYRGLVKINESVVGETFNTGITTPVTPHGTFYISFLPLESMKRKILLPLTRKLSVGKNAQLAGTDEFLSICTWPDNIYEIEINPPYYCMPDETEVYYKEISSFDFLIGQKQYILSVLKDYQCYIQIEEAVKKRIAYAFPLGFEVQSAKIALNRLEEAPYIIVEGMAEEGAFIIILALRPDFKVIIACLCDSCEMTAENIQIVSRLENGQKTISSVGTSEGQIHLLKVETDFMQNNTKNANEVVKEFLLCMQNRMPQAMDYLTVSLKEGLTMRDLEDFFGEFVSIGVPLVPLRDCRDITWACKYKTAENFYMARIFCFEHYVTRDGRILIDNIKEP